MATRTKNIPPHPDTTMPAGAICVTRRDDVAKEDVAYYVLADGSITNRTHGFVVPPNSRTARKIRRFLHTEKPEIRPVSYTRETYKDAEGKERTRVTPSEEKTPVSSWTQWKRA